jgi:hypothetical protein
MQIRPTPWNHTNKWWGIQSADPPRLQDHDDDHEEKTPDEPYSPCCSVESSRPPRPTFPEPSPTVPEAGIASPE